MEDLAAALQEYHCQPGVSETLPRADRVRTAILADLAMEWDSACFQWAELAAFGGSGFRIFTLAASEIGVFTIIL